MRNWPMTKITDTEKKLVNQEQRGNQSLTKHSDTEKKLVIDKKY